MHATIPKGNMGYDQYAVPGTVAVESSIVAFLQHSQTLRLWPLVLFFQISLKNSELKTTHNTFRDCRMHFSQQPFSKYLCVYLGSCPQKLRFSPGNLFWDSFTNYNTENFLRHDINITTNHTKPFPLILSLHLQFPWTRIWCLTAVDLSFLWGQGSYHL